LIGATLNPWMLFHQSSAVVAKRLGPSDYPAARADTLVGGLLTQLLTAGVLAAVAALRSADLRARSTTSAKSAGRSRRCLANSPGGSGSASAS
jgi:Mn2+/Fe2+ NRAMP family transporter